MPRRVRKKPVRHHKTVPVQSMVDLVNSFPDYFCLEMCETVTHRFYRFGYSVFDIVDTDGRQWYLPLPASHFAMFTRNPT